MSETISSGNFARIVELFPPGLPSPDSMKESQRFDLSLRFERLVQSISELEAVADAFSLPELRDGTRIHLNSIAVASELEKRTGCDIIPTITLRDANKQNILGLISYAIFAGLENLQIVRGDPYLQESTVPKNVYDISKVSKLVSLIRKIEAHSSNTDPLCILAPINMMNLDNRKYVKTIRERQDSGVDLFVTESLFEDTERYLRRVVKLRKDGVKAPLIHNIFPFRDYDDAVSCKQKFGWRISTKELHGLKTKGPNYGLEVARKKYYDLLDRRDIVEGVCISTRGNPELVKLITS
ncbi:MAG: methylenetetrahydrofolate reductase [Nitrososphaerales archaeon]